LNYGQSIIEGLKAQRTKNGQIVLFRPVENAARMREGAKRMSMVAPDEELFMKGVLSTVRQNVDMVPPEGKGSLYLRPLLLGTGPILGLGSAPSFTFTVYAAPVGSYFKVCCGMLCRCSSPHCMLSRPQHRLMLNILTHELYVNTKGAGPEGDILLHA
jgi:branched-subunit amino acid aminotransferase/4-amino-4-deoxychorismate lyase